MQSNNNIKRTKLQFFYLLKIDFLNLKEFAIIKMRSPLTAPV